MAEDARLATRVSDVGYWLVSILVVGAIWAGTATSVAPHLARPFSAGVLPSGAIVWIGVAAILAVQIALARFAGPRRASAAELAWRTYETPPSTQIIQVAGINAALAALVGILLCVVAGESGYSAAGVVLVATVCVLSVPAALATAAATQRTTHPVAAGGNGWIRRRRKKLVPRWKLMRADANVHGATFSLLTLDASALRVTSDLRDTGRRRRIARPRLRWLRLAYTTGRRGLARLWVRGAAAILVVALGLALGLAQIAWAVALFACILLSTSAAHTWAEWVSEPSIRRGFCRIRGRDAAVLAGASMPSLLFTVAAAAVFIVWFTVLSGGPGLAAIPRDLILWIPLLLFLPPAVIAARGRAALQSSDAANTVVNTAELGPIPVGQIGRLSAGWTGAVCVIVSGLVHPVAGIVVLAVWAALLGEQYWREASCRSGE